MNICTTKNLPFCTRKTTNPTDSTPPPPEGTGTPFRDCARDCNNCVHTRAQISAIGVTEKILFERLYLVPGMGTFGPCVNCPYAPTTQTVHPTTISRFTCNFPPEWLLIFLVSTKHQVIWPSPGTLPSVLVKNKMDTRRAEYSLTLVAGSIFRLRSQTHISKRQFKNERPYLQILLCFSSNPSNLVGKVSAEEVDLSFKSETKEHPQISKPSLWKRDSENVFLQMF